MSAYAVNGEISLDLKRLKILAAAFRKAIEQCDRNRLPISFETFPGGSCGDTTHLLGAFLREQGMGTFRYICGERGTGWSNWHSHAWLESNGVIVDITADQFSERTDRVIVTTDSAWHAAFTRKSVQVADYRHSGDARSRAILGEAYHAILENLMDTGSERQIKHKFEKRLSDCGAGKSAENSCPSGGTSRLKSRKNQFRALFQSAIAIARRGLLFFRVKHAACL